MTDPGANDLPLVSVRRRLGAADYVLIEIDGPRETWLNHPAAFPSRQAARDELRALGRVEAVPCPECEDGYVGITERCPRCSGRCIVPAA